MTNGKIKVAPDGNSAKLTGKGVGQGTNVKMPPKTQTNINKVNIQSKTKIGETETENNTRLLVDMILNSSIDNARYYLKLVEAEEKATIDNKSNTTSDINKVTLKRQQVEALIEEKIAIDELDKAIKEENAAEANNPELVVFNAKIDKMLESQDVAGDEALKYEHKRLVDADHDLTKTRQKSREAIDNLSKCRNRCKELGIDMMYKNFMEMETR